MAVTLLTAACTIDARVVKVIDHDASDGSDGRDATGMARDASETSDASAGAGGTTGGASDASGNSDGANGGRAGASGSAGAAGKGGVAGGSGSAGASGSAGRAGGAGKGGSGGVATGGAAGAAGAGGGGARGGAAGNAGAGGGGGTTGGAGGATGGAAGAAGATMGGAGGAAGGSTGGAAGSAGTAGGRGGGAGTDVADAGSDAPVGGTIVIYEELFDNATLGTFAVASGCGMSPPVWSNFAGYAHADELSAMGVSSIYSPSIVIPANVSQIKLRFRHKLHTDFGYNGGQLLLTVNGGALTLVSTFTQGGYSAEGVGTHPDTCFKDGTPNWHPGWSGNLTEFESEINVSDMPFNVVPGDTVSIRLRMLADNTKAFNGWDIDWVRLTATTQ